jgi:thiamine biosynthesis lipoprotein
MAAKLSATTYKRNVKLMGNRFEITVVSKEESDANQKIDIAITEIRRIETLLTTYSDNSLTSMVNKMAGIKPVVVDTEFYELIKRSIRISEITQGAFDITYGAIDKRLWNFDNSMEALPSKEDAAKSVHLINYRNVVLDEKNKTVFLTQKGMRIGFGGIGKGYAAERAKQVLLNEGVSNGIVNAAGDLTVWGKQPSGEEWTIGIADPNAVTKPFSYLKITDMAVATSGNYEKFVIINGKRYSHTINPKTGLPVQGIKSVTIFSPNAEIADAMATPVMIMGVKVGIGLINQINGLHCIVVDDNDEVHTSKYINLQ